MYMYFDHKLPFLPGHFAWQARVHSVSVGVHVLRYTSSARGQLNEHRRQKHLLYF